jgi:catechol 2,3-dioxygenase
MTTGAIRTRPPCTGVRVGHVHLRASDLDRSAAFYRDIVGLEITFDARPRGLPIVFLAASGYHHYVALNTFESAGASPPPAGHTGLLHVAFVYPDEMSLAAAARRAVERSVTIDSGRDHGGTVSLYLADPDRNGVELYFDRPRDRWFDADGRFRLQNDRFDPLAWLDKMAAPASEMHA